MLTTFRVNSCGKAPLEVAACVLLWTLARTGRLVHEKSLVLRRVADFGRDLRIRQSQHIDSSGLVRLCIRSQVRYFARQATVRTSYLGMMWDPFRDELGDSAGAAFCFSLSSDRWALLHPRR
jgi:hypothetical protein